MTVEANPDIDLPPKAGEVIDAKAEPTQAVENVPKGTSISAPIDRPVASQEQFYSLIERCIRDPGIDILRITQLMEIRDRENAIRSESMFDLAMAEAQQQMQPIRANAENKHTNSQYATYGALDAEMRPIYTRHGFSISFDTEDAPRENMVRVIAIVKHTGGHKTLRRIDMPADGQGAKGGSVMTRTHATGSAVSYGMRYLLKMIFNIVTTNDRDDDDGNRAGTRDASKVRIITDKQVEELQELITETKTEIEKFLKYASDRSRTKVESLSDIPERSFRDLKSMLLKKKGGGKKDERTGRQREEREERTRTPERRNSRR